jgi:hypothetical protein
MTVAVKQFITLAGGLIIAFLVLTHFTGFARDVGAISSGSVSVIKTLQGR